MANAKSKKWNAHIALGFCPECKSDLISPRGGLFQRCKCGASFIDQERFGGLYVRLGGEAEFVEQICPQNCKIKEHKKYDRNKKDIKKLPSKKGSCKKG